MDVLVSSTPIKLCESGPRFEDEIVSTDPSSVEMLCLARESLGPTVQFADDVVLETFAVVRIFGFLDVQSLGRACRVSKAWRRVAEDNVCWRALRYHCACCCLLSHCLCVPSASARSRGLICSKLTALGNFASSAVGVRSRTTRYRGTSVAHLNADSP